MTIKGNYSPCGGEGGWSLSHTPMLSTSDYPFGKDGLGFYCYLLPIIFHLFFLPSWSLYDEGTGGEHSIE